MKLTMDGKGIVYKDGQRLAPGELPPGTYEIEVAQEDLVSLTLGHDYPTTGDHGLDHTGKPYFGEQGRLHGHRSRT